MDRNSQIITWHEHHARLAGKDRNSGLVVFALFALVGAIYAVLAHEGIIAWRLW